MKKMWVGYLAGLAAVGIAFYVGTIQQKEPIYKNKEDVRNVGDISTNSTPMHSDTIADNENFSSPLEAIELASKQYNDAVAKREAAEKLFDEIELAVAELEDHIDELEDNGSSLEDIQSETLTKFQQVFESYQDAELALQAAREEEEKSLETLKEIRK